MNKPEGYFELDVIDPINNKSEYHYEGKNTIVINSSTIMALSMLNKYHINYLLVGNGSLTNTGLITSLANEISKIPIDISSAKVVDASSIIIQSEDDFRILEGQKALSLSVISDTLLVSSITEFGLAFVDDNNKILFNYKSVASPIQCLNKKIRITWKIIF